ncbi:MAG: S9 family peptidase [Colwellia sp.]|nr:S9 family peptidase [Colwellia sp.]
MKKPNKAPIKIISLISIIMMMLGCNNTSTNQKNTAQPAAPVAKKIPYEINSNGNKRIDEYYWLRDDSRSAPEVLAHLNAEEAYMRASMAHTETLQNKLYAELTERLQKDESSVPIKKGSYWYQSRYVVGGEYRQHVRMSSAESKEFELLIDENQLAEGLGYFALRGRRVSSNENLLAYGVDKVGRRIYTIHFKNLKTDQLLTDTLENTSGTVEWSNDNKTVFYIRKDPETLLGYQVFRHELGTKQSADVLVFEEKNKSYYTYLSKSLDQKYIYIHHYSTTVQGQSFIDANQPKNEVSLVHSLDDNLEYSAYSHLDDFYILTNWQAQNFRLMKTKKSTASDQSTWQEVIADKKDVYLDNVLVFEKHLVVRARKNGLIQIQFIELTTMKSKTLTFEDSVYTAGFDDNAVFDTDKVRLYYSSLTTPTSIFDVNLADRKRVLLKQDKVIGNFDANNYFTERKYFKARDGVEVPVSLVYRKDLFKHDGTNPLYQYGYGSYGNTIAPYFNSRVLSLLDRGFVYAIAHIRGGELLGRQWYESGKLLNKKNSFTDFIDVTKALVEQKYADKEKVFAVGGSAGGLLMGAIINDSPELYRGVAAHVPFVDVVTTMLDESIPLTTNEFDEWGNPKQQQYYDYMLSYSPYDNVQAKDYPNLLVTTGLHDSQVQYFEPAKWVARLRALKTDNNALYFHINMEGGHGGKSGRYRRYKDKALEFAFFFDLIGIDH